MSCDLLEHAKEAYKVENGTVPTEVPQISHEIVVQPKIIQNTSVEQVFQTYTNVSTEPNFCDCLDIDGCVTVIFGNM